MFTDDSWRWCEKALSTQSQDCRLEAMFDEADGDKHGVWLGWVGLLSVLCPVEKPFCFVPEKIKISQKKASSGRKAISEKFLSITIFSSGLVAVAACVFD